MPKSSHWLNTGGERFQKFINDKNARRNYTPLLPAPEPLASITNKLFTSSVSTKICDFWKRGQICKYGARCWFAHGPLPLRIVDENRLMNNEKYGEIVLKAGNRVMHSSPTQLTPEQKHWMFLSERTENLINAPNNCLGCRPENILDAITFPPPPIKLFDPALKEFEQEQMAAYPSSSTAQRAFGAALPMFMPLQPYQCLLAPGPSTSNSACFSSCLEKTASETNSSLCSSITAIDKDEVTQPFFIPFEKEECALHMFGQCPFGNNCFFKHLPSDVNEEVE